jgi:hypothetical protein
MWPSWFTAPYVLDRAINGEIFRAYVEEMLAPSSGRVTPSS